MTNWTWYFKAFCFIFCLFLCKNHTSVFWRIKNKPQQTIFWQIPQFVKQKAVLVYLRCSGDIHRVLQSVLRNVCLDSFRHFNSQRTSSILDFESNTSLLLSLQSWRVQNMTWVENPQEFTCVYRDMSFNISSTGGKKAIQILENHP